MNYRYAQIQSERDQLQSGAVLSPRSPGPGKVATFAAPTHTHKVDGGYTTTTQNPKTPFTVAAMQINSISC